MYGFGWLKNMITESDNTTHCPVRVGAVFTGATYHAGVAWMVFVQQAHVDMSFLGSYIQHMGVLMGLTSASIGAKSMMKADAPK